MLRSFTENKHRYSSKMDDDDLSTLSLKSVLIWKDETAETDDRPKDDKRQLSGKFLLFVVIFVLVLLILLIIYHK